MNDTLSVVADAGVIEILADGTPTVPVKAPPIVYPIADDVTVHGLLVIGPPSALVNVIVRGPGVDALSSMFCATPLFVNVSGLLTLNVSPATDDVNDTWSDVTVLAGLTEMFADSAPTVDVLAPPIVYPTDAVNVHGLLAIVPPSALVNVIVRGPGVDAVSSMFCATPLFVNVSGLDTLNVSPVTDDVNDTLSVVADAGAIEIFADGTPTVPVEAPPIVYPMADDVTVHGLLVIGPPSALVNVIVRGPGVDALSSMFCATPLFVNVSGLLTLNVSPATDDVNDTWSDVTVLAGLTEMFADSAPTVDVLAPPIVYLTDAVNVHGLLAIVPPSALVNVIVRGPGVDAVSSMFCATPLFVNVSGLDTLNVSPVTDDVNDTLSVVAVAGAIEILADGTPTVPVEAPPIVYPIADDVTVHGLLVIRPPSALVNVIVRGPGVDALSSMFCATPLFVNVSGLLTLNVSPATDDVNDTWSDVTVLAGLTEMFADSAPTVDVLAPPIVYPTDAVNVHGLLAIVPPSALVNVIVRGPGVDAVSSMFCATPLFVNVSGLDTLNVSPVTDDVNDTLSVVADAGAIEIFADGTPTVPVEAPPIVYPMADDVTVHGLLVIGPPSALVNVIVRGPGVDALSSMFCATPLFVNVSGLLTLNVSPATDDVNDTWSDVTVLAGLTEMFADSAAHSRRIGTSNRISHRRR